MGAFDLDKTASNNTSTPDGTNIAEGCAAGNINDAQRETLAIIANLIADQGGELEAGGTANALTLTTNSTVPALADGVMLALVAASTNTGATTLNVDTLGAKAIRKSESGSDVALAAGDLQGGGHYTVRYDASADGGSGAWVLLEARPGGVLRRIIYIPYDADAGDLPDHITKSSAGSFSYDPPAGLKFAEVEVQGGGGAGGQANAPTAGQGSAGGGGGAGGWQRGVVEAGDLSSSETLTVGAAGSTTSFGALLSATGGSSGSNGGADSSTITTNGGAGGSASGSSASARGMSGMPGLRTGFPSGTGGDGASSRYGGGGRGVRSFSGSGSAGGDAQGYGAGGAGGSSSDTAGVQAGGAGAPGLIIIREYF